MQFFSLKYLQAISGHGLVLHSNSRTPVGHPRRPWTLRAEIPWGRQTPDAGRRVWCPGLEETAPDRGCSIIQVKEVWQREGKRES